MASNRETARDKVVTLLLADLVGTGKPAAQVLGHKAGKADFEAGVPLVAVLSRATHRERMTRQGSRATFTFEIHSLVLAASSDGTTWTEAMAEDRLDLIDATIAGTVDTFNNAAKTDTVTMIGLGESAVGELPIGGEAYLEEVTPCTVEVFA
jgi:hypothetical protein